VRLRILFVVLLFTLAAHSQDLKFYRVQVGADDSVLETIRFFCGEGYDKDECLRDVAALRKALSPYPLRLLGEWSFYLVLAPDWKLLAVAPWKNGASGSTVRFR